MLQDKLLKVIRIVLAILVILWFMLLFYFSSQNGIESSKLSRKAVENILEIKDEFSTTMDESFTSYEVYDLNEGEIDYGKHKGRQRVKRFKS